MHSPRVGRPSIWEERTPTKTERRVDPTWFAEPSLLSGLGGSLHSLKASVPSSPRGLPRSYTTVTVQQRPASPAASIRREVPLRPPSPSASVSSTNRRLATPYQTRAQTPKNHHPAPPSAQHQIAPPPARGRTPTRVETSFLAAALPPERTPLRNPIAEHCDITPSPARVSSFSYRGHTRDVGVPTAASVDSYGSAGITEASADSDSYFANDNPTPKKYVPSQQQEQQQSQQQQHLTTSQLLAALAQHRASTPGRHMSSPDLKQPIRSAAPLLNSLHSPRSIIPTPATPTLFRRADSDAPFASPVLARAASDGHFLLGHRAVHRESNAAAEEGKEMASGRTMARASLRGLVCSWENRYKENSKCYREGGYLPLSKGDVMHQRYEMLNKLGWGEFSTVWLARDRCPSQPHQTFVAVKVAKCHPSVTNSTIYEINLLRYICGTSKMCGAPITRLLDAFEHQGPYGVHQCMVMPVMGSNLLCVVDQMKAKKRKRLEKELIMFKEITAATLRALDSLEAINVVHTDLKPENVLVSVPDPKMVKLAASCASSADEAAVSSFEMGDAAMPVVAVADFGLSFLLEHPGYMPTGAEKVGVKKDLDVQYPGIANNKKGILIQTREYRAPEVLFGGPLCSRSDIWSLGCMVYELITGEFLLDPKQKTTSEKDMDVEHVAMIMRVLGPVPSHIAKASQNPARHLGRYFDAEGRFLYADKYRNTPRRSIATELEAFLEPAEAERAAQFIMSCFTYDPLERCHARDLLNHSWLRSTRV